MKCPECGTGKLMVKDSRDRGGETFRRRVCDGCGAIVKTTELPTAGLIQVQKRANANVHTEKALIKKAIKSLQEIVKQ